MASFPKLLRVNNVEEQYGIPETTLRHWRSTGGGPPYSRLGRRIVYREDELVAWLNAQLEASKEAS